MKKNAIKQYVALRDSLLKEKNELEERLAEINAALGAESAPAPQAAPKRRQSAPARATGRRRGGKRNGMSLREAVVQVTSEKPRTKQEILDAIEKIGYRFRAKNPVNSLNTVLYSKKQFKNVDGRFSPVA